MKLRLFILLTLLCFVPPCESRAQCTEDTPCPELARLNPCVLGGGVPAADGECTVGTATEQVVCDISSYSSFGITTTTRYLSEEFTIASAITVTHLKVFCSWMSDYLNGSLIAEILGDSAGEPNEADVKASKAIGYASLPVDDLAWVTFEFDSPVELAAGTYYVNYRCTGTDIYAKVAYTDGGSVCANMSHWYSNDSGTNWTEYSSEELGISVWGCSE